MPNRKLSDAKGDPWSTITLPVINAEDQSKIKKSGNNLIIFNSIAQNGHVIGTSSLLSCI